MRPARLTVLAIWMVLAIAGGGCEAIAGAMMRADHDAYLRDNERKRELYGVRAPTTARTTSDADSTCRGAD
jgi:hypothetical protein